VLPWSPLARALLAGNRASDGERLTTRAQTDQFTEDALAAEQLSLSDEEIARLEEPCVPHAIAGH
jgi:hypothetical protein